jgi:hypothetical protein
MPAEQVDMEQCIKEFDCLEDANNEDMFINVVTEQSSDVDEEMCMSE